MAFTSSRIRLADSPKLLSEGGKGAVEEMPRAQLKLLRSFKGKRIKQENRRERLPRNTTVQGKSTWKVLS